MDGASASLEIAASTFACLSPLVRAADTALTAPFRRCGLPHDAALRLVFILAKLATLGIDVSVAVIFISSRGLELSEADGEDDDAMLTKRDRQVDGFDGLQFFGALVIFFFFLLPLPAIWLWHGCCAWRRRGSVAPVKAEGSYNMRTAYICTFLSVPSRVMYRASAPQRTQTPGSHFLWVDLGAGSLVLLQCSVVGLQTAVLYLGQDDGVMSTAEYAIVALSTACGLLGLVTDALAWYAIVFGRGRSLRRSTARKNRGSCCTLCCCFNGAVTPCCALLIAVVVLAVLTAAITVAAGVVPFAIPGIADQAQCSRSLVAETKRLCLEVCEENDDTFLEFTFVESTCNVTRLAQLQPDSFGEYTLAGCTCKGVTTVISTPAAVMVIACILYVVYWLPVLLFRSHDQDMDERMDVWGDALTA